MARLGQKDKAEVELYVARELAYQQSLNTQHERHVALANAKKQEIEEANTRKHERQILGGRVFGEGYKGYGNARTESTSRIIYPQDRKRPRRTSEFRCLDLKKHAEKATSLAPIRLDLEVEGYKLRDTFTWDHYDTCVSAEHFADMLCEDLHLPRHMFKAPIIASIKEQIDDYGAHYPSAALESGDQRKPPSSTSSLASLGNEDLRILIKLDIVVGNWSLMDQFEWDVGDPNNDPEHFATILASELGLGGEFRTAIAHAIREQVFCYQKSLFLLGHPFDGTSVQDPDLKQSFRNPVEYIIREEKQIDMFTPVLIHLTDAEIEKMERDRERESRQVRKRRQTRGRRGVNLPDREPLKTHNTLIAVPPIQEMTDDQFIASLDNNSNVALNMALGNTPRSWSTPSSMTTSSLTMGRRGPGRRAAGDGKAQQHSFINHTVNEPIHRSSPLRRMG